MQVPTYMYIENSSQIRKKYYAKTFKLKLNFTEARVPSIYLSTKNNPMYVDYPHFNIEKE